MVLWPYVPHSSLANSVRVLIQGYSLWQYSAKHLREISPMGEMTMELGRSALAVAAFFACSVTVMIINAYLMC